LYSNAPSHLKPENTINNSSNSSPVAVRRNWSMSFAYCTNWL
jgi:hypothetical protein